MSATILPSTLSRVSGLDGDKASLEPQNQVRAVTSESDDQGVSSIRTVDGLVRHRARTYPHDHILSYPASGVQFVDYTLQQLDVFAWRVAKHYGGLLPLRTCSAEKPIVVGLLGPSNLEYIVSMLALNKMGHTALLISTRIPQVAVENLLEVTQASALVVEGRFEELAQNIQQKKPSLKLAAIAPRGAFEYSIEAHGDTRLDSHLDSQVETENIAFIIHSSGSTGLPKPIYQTQRSCLANYASTLNMKAFITLPLFHNHGICNFFRAVYTRKPIHVYNADLPLTRDYLVRIMRENPMEIFYGVPYALKLLSESEEGLRLLQQFKIVMYGGSACPDDLGNALVKNRVNLVSHYGATEVGQLMTSFRPQGDEAWNYVREHERLSPFLKWVPRGPNLFECVVTDGWPPKVQSNQPDGSYATRDLFEPHPTVPKAWKYNGRLDDTIVLVNGEKFNPVAMEGSIRSDKNVTEAVVFGAGRPYLGALIVPSASLSEKSHEEALDLIWPVVDAANNLADAFARISKDMICILPHDTPYPRTDKGSIVRQSFYKSFDDHIQNAYDTRDIAGGDLQNFYELPQLKEHLRRLLASTLATDSPIDDNADLFLLGLDSLQAIQTRSEILKTVEVGDNELEQNLVFEHPSVAQLAQFLFDLQNGHSAASKSVEETMMDMINRYSTIKTCQKASILVTGASGSLGAHVAAQLALNPGIGSVYCLVRAANPAESMLRVKKSLMQRRVYHTLPLSARRKLIAFHSDLSDPKLGLSATDYGLVSRNVSSVIHCAWSVNFNMHISSFEKSNISGVNHLLGLCKASLKQASFNFCSSISTCSRCTGSPVPETLPDISWAQAMGYAQSKSVAEHICATAAKQGIMSRVLRVGQIIGDTKHGVWNAQEAVPMMMQTALTIGALPKLKETPSWLPVDIMAQAIVDISLSEFGSGFFNVTNPRTFDWTNDLLPALKMAGLSFAELEPIEWLDKLRSCPLDPSENPPIKLVDFFASKYDKTEFGPPKAFTTDRACSFSPALAAAPVVGAQLVQKYVSYFLETSWKRKPALDKTAIIMAGPCGSGKTSVGSAIAKDLGIPFIEGDALHTKVAVDKMRSGTALFDEDRSGWLGRVCYRAREGLIDLGYEQLVLSCSALKATYRSRIRESLSKEGLGVLFIDLQAEVKTLMERLDQREDHYMSPQMVKGQLSLYEGATDEETDVLPVDAEQSEQAVVEEVKWLMNSVIGLGYPAA